MEHASLKLRQEDAPTTVAGAESLWRGVPDATLGARSSLSDFHGRSAHGLQRIHAVDAKSSEMQRREERSQIADLSTIKDTPSLLAWLHGQPSTVSPAVLEEIASKMLSASVTSSVQGGSEEAVRTRLEEDAKLEGASVAGSAFAITQEDIQGYQRYLASRRSIPGSALSDTPPSDSLRSQRHQLADEFQVAVSGADRGAVSQVISYMNKRGVVPSVETLQNLLLSDVSWKQAMQVAQIYVHITGSTLPPIAMATKLMSTLLLTPPSQGKWVQGLALYSAYYEAGRQDELSPASHGFALQFIKRAALSLRRPQTRLEVPGYAKERNQLWNAALVVMTAAAQHLDATNRQQLVDDAPLGLSETDALFLISSGSQLMRSFGSWGDAIKVLHAARLSASATDEEQAAAERPSHDDAKTAVEMDESPKLDLFGEVEEEEVSLSGIFGSDDMDDSLATARRESSDSGRLRGVKVLNNQNGLVVHTPQTLIHGMIAALVGRSAAHLALFVQAFDRFGYSYQHVDVRTLQGLLAAIRDNVFSGMPFSWVEKVISDLSRAPATTGVPPRILLGSLAMVLEGAKSAALHQINEPSGSLWELGVRLFLAVDAQPFDSLSESSIEHRIARMESLMGALVSVCSCCAAIQERAGATEARRQWSRPTDLTPLEERLHQEATVFEAAFAPHERLNWLLTHEISTYVDASYGTHSVEAGLLAKALLDFPGPTTIRSSTHALSLLAKVSQLLPSFSGQMAAARMGVRDYLVWASTAHPANLSRRSLRTGSGGIPAIDVRMEWRDALEVLDKDELMQQPVIGGDPFEVVSRAAILSAAGSVHTEAILHMLTSVPRLYRYTHREKVALGNVLATAIHAATDQDGWAAFEARKHTIRVVSPADREETH